MSLNLTAVASTALIPPLASVRHSDEVEANFVVTEKE
jgi:hypothetical protein